MAGHIDSNVVNSWKAKINASLNSTKIQSKTTGKPWSTSLWGCFAPIDLCAITCCLPCVTFGKTHHRLENNGDMTTYEPINTSCILFYLSTCFGAHFILQSIQLAELREKHGLEGGCIPDLIKSCCCGCCTLIQAEKESRLLLGEKTGGVVDQQYAAGPGAGGMMYEQGKPPGGPN
ncbi:PLAC8 family-domain-containing protein [Phaeosphaeriaceae sp. PMI808]|nr:PLAC8 family-domain-containing protein [Phaeosphaeriaceae sp. PMI808]